MKLVNQKSNIWGEVPTNKEKAILWIESAGRTCYRSEDKIVDGSGLKFVTNIWKRKHFSVLEHSNLVIRTRYKSKFPEIDIFNSPFFNFHIYKDRVYIGGNWRAWIEWSCNAYTIDDLPNILINTDKYEVVDKEDIPVQLKAVTVEFVTDRATTHEIVRHRTASFSQESQRYVRYDNVTFIKPWWYDNTFRANKERLNIALLDAEEHYKYLIDHGQKAEEARAVLPNATATKIIVTTTIPRWNLIFNLRTSKAAYPQIRNLMIPVQNDFKENGWK
jgi:thymidylate synthase (FAD)